MSHGNAAHAKKSTNVRKPVPGAVLNGFKISSRIAPKLTGRLAGKLFCMPTGPRTPRPREQEWLNSAEPLELRIDDRKLAAWSWGQGPVVLMHHGWNGRGGQLGAFAQPLADAGYRVVAYDAPAHGASSGRFTTGVEWARTIHQVSRALGGVHAIVAHSLGCLATSYALREELSIERMVFVSPPADMVTFTREFADLVELNERVYNHMLSHFEAKLAMNWENFGTEKLAESDRTVRGGQTPLLVIHDSQDVRVPIRHAHRIHAAWEGSRLIETTGLGHQRILRDADVVRQTVEFVSGSD